MLDWLYNLLMSFVTFIFGLFGKKKVTINEEKNTVHIIPEESQI
jgi:hypothetical protein